MSYREWHYWKAEREWGPLTRAELAELVGEGHLDPAVLVRRSDCVEWLPFSDAVDLSDHAPPLPVLPADGVLPYEIPRELSPRLYASFGARCGAFLLDYFLLSVPLMIAFALLEWLGVQVTERLQQAVFVVVVWVYYAWMESSSLQGTLGKQAAGLIVTDPQGRPISFLRATGRVFAKALSVATFYVGFLLVLFTRRKQALHDLIVGTVVLRK